jgi:predicted amidohydrolase
MSEDYIGIAVGSTFCRIGDLQYNLAQIGTFAEQARRAGSHVLLTPELSATGYGPYPEVVNLAEKAGEGAIYEGLAKIVKKTGVIVAAGFTERHDHGAGISHYVVFPGGSFVVQRKYRVTPFENPLVSRFPTHPQGVDVPEKLDFAALKFPTFQIQGLICALAICADACIENLQDHFDTLGVRLMLGPSGAGGDVNERVRSADLLTPDGLEKYKRALDKHFFPSRQTFLDCLMRRRALAAVNQSGWDERKCSHLGDGAVIAPTGEMPVFIYGIPNLDYQRPAFGAGRIPLAHFTTSTAATNDVPSFAADPIAQ